MDCFVVVRVIGLAYEVMGGMGVATTAIDLIANTNVQAQTVE